MSDGLVDTGPTVKMPPPAGPVVSENPPSFIIIGAGSRGNAYASAIRKCSNAVIAAVAEPIQSKRQRFGNKYIWGSDKAASEGQSFADWTEFVEYETERRRREDAGEENVPPGVEGAFVCVLDEMHRDVVVALAGLQLHIMCEKPLATTFEDVLVMYKALQPLKKKKVFSIGHVLRYSPHNILLRKLLVELQVIGTINSAVHTEPVGWWHYTHSYVRGNWRNSSKTGPSLLTKSCHDVDLIMWLLASPLVAGHGDTHLPKSVSSSGHLSYFTKMRKPDRADSTNCMTCQLGDEGCKYSAKHVYLGPKYKGLETGNVKWPMDVLVPDIEDYPTQEEKVSAVTKVLEEDYDKSTPESEVRSRNWFGRCVFESDNDVCDEQFVTFAWPDTIRPAKHAVFHMVAQTNKQCDRYSNFYGDNGEIYADSTKIVVENFEKKTRETYRPTIEDIGHGGGDIGLTRQFVLACGKTKNDGMSIRAAQDEIIGCTLEEVLRAHVAVFAAEEARLENKVVDWREWWQSNVQDGLRALGPPTFPV